MAERCQVTEILPGLRYGLPTVRRLAKIIGWSVGFVFALAIVAYAILVLVNLDDRPPIAEIAVLQSLQEDPSPVTDEGNSYLYILGFAGPPDSNPMSLGLERHRWLEVAGPDFESSGDPLRDDYDFRALRTKDVAELSGTCRDSELDCSIALEANREVIDQWLADERWLLERYRTLISMTEFAEATPFEILAPLPSFDVLLEGQRLLMTDAWRSARDGDTEAVRTALDQDLAYWRLVLRNSNVLITKMIASAAIARSFNLGNSVLRRLPQDVAVDGIPPSWRQQISAEERSMKRCFAGEWGFFDGTMKRMFADPDNPSGDWMGLTDVTVWDRLGWLVMKPFWQPQDLSNRYARLMLDLGNAFDVPYEEIPNTSNRADELRMSTYRPFSRLYNLAGDLEMSKSGLALSNYALRVADLEGIRRASLLASELRADGVGRDEVARRVLVSEIVDPYTGEPFTWDDDSGAIVFNGLEPNHRSRHELFY